MSVTKEEIDNAIYNCPWKDIIDGKDTCTASSLPCSKAAEDGKCDVLTNLCSSNEED